MVSCVHIISLAFDFLPSLRHVSSFFSFLFLSHSLFPEESGLPSCRRSFISSSFSCLFYSSHLLFITSLLASFSLHFPSALFFHFSFSSFHPFRLISLIPPCLLCLHLLTSRYIFIQSALSLHLFTSPSFILPASFLVFPAFFLNHEHDLPHTT